MEGRLDFDMVNSSNANARVPTKPGQLQLAIAVRFVDECVSRVKVSDPTFDDARKAFSASELTEMTLLVGFYMMTARFLATFGIDLDATPVDWRRADRQEVVPYEPPASRWQSS